MILQKIKQLFVIKDTINLSRSSNYLHLCLLHEIMQCLLFQFFSMQLFDMMQESSNFFHIFVYTFMLQLYDITNADYSKNYIVQCQIPN